MTTYAQDQRYRRELEQHLFSHPDDEYALIQLGALLWEPFHEVDQGIDLLERALQINPTSVDARFWLAQCHLRDLCDFEKAKTLLEEAIQIDPGRADCHFLLAATLCDLKKPAKDYAAVFHQATVLAPSWPLPLICYVEALIETNQIQLAENVAKKGLACDFPWCQPVNAVQEYYELAVTGLGNREILHSLQKLLDEIARKKKRK